MYHTLVSVMLLTSEDPAGACLDAATSNFCRNERCRKLYNETCFEHRSGKPAICKDLRKCIEDSFLNFEANLKHGHESGNMTVCTRLQSMH
jgi:hypothetical protein